MSRYRFMKWVPCPECDGTCKVWVTLKGANVRTTARCLGCIFGQVQREMTREEVLEALGPEAATPSPSLPQLSQGGS